MKDILLPDLGLAGIDRHRSARIDKNNSASINSLAAELCFLLVEGRPTQVRNPVIEKIICLGLQRIGADRHNRVGELSILVAIVEFANPHVARGVDFGIVSRPVVNPDILDLHSAEVELTSAPCVLVATARASVVVGRDEEPILALFVDDRCGYAGDEIKRIVPARWLELAIAPNEGISQSLELSIALS